MEKQRVALERLSRKIRPYPEASTSFQGRKTLFSATISDICYPVLYFIQARMRQLFSISIKFFEQFVIRKNTPRKMVCLLLQCIYTERSIGFAPCATASLFSLYSVKNYK